MTAPLDHPTGRAKGEWLRRAVLGAAGASVSGGPGADALGDARHLSATPTGTALSRRARGAISSDVIRGFAQLVDVAAIMASGVVAIEAYTNGLLGNIFDQERYWLAVALGALIFPFVHRKAGGYTTPRLAAVTWQVGRMVATLAVTLSILTTLAFMAKVAPYYSRGWATLFVTLSFGTLASIRMGAALLIQHWTHAGRLSRMVAVVGAGPLGEQVVRKLKAAEDARVSVVGVFDDRIAGLSQR